MLLAGLQGGVYFTLCSVCSLSPRTNLQTVCSCVGSSRMKGGSMTALLLNTVFSLALSRAYSIPLSVLLGIPDSCAPSHNPSLGSNDVKNGTEGDGSCCHILSEGEEQVALMVDAFQATYSAAYRSDNCWVSLQFGLQVG